jgi:hypothetical protein
VAILLEPDGARLKITLKGAVAGMLIAARDSTRSSDSGVQITLVAGAAEQRGAEGAVVAGEEKFKSAPATN